MDILRKSPGKVLVELAADEMMVIHCALYQWKTCLKHTALLNKDKKREKLMKLNRMITLVDLLI